MKEYLEKHLAEIGRRNFLKSAGIAAVGIAGIGFLNAAEPGSNKKPARRTR